MSDIKTNLPELKPCPFCGGTSIKIDSCTMRITCKTCFCHGPLMMLVKDREGKDERQIACEAWNTRA